MLLVGRVTHVTHDAARSTVNGRVSRLLTDWLTEETYEFHGKSTNFLIYITRCYLK